MQRRTRQMAWGLVLAASVLPAAIACGAAPPEGSTKPSGADQAANDDQTAIPATLDEARGRARLLHETIHATLQIVHLQYYREDEGLDIPARTMKRVFAEVARSCNVQLHWLVVNAKAMNVDHNPRDDFEKNAAQSIASGKREFERFENGVYRYAGAITLSSECLKCHLPNRTSTQDRAAGLVIAMAVGKR